MAHMFIYLRDHSSRLATKRTHHLSRIETKHVEHVPEVEANGHHRESCLVE